MKYEEFCEKRDSMELGGVSYFVIVVWALLYEGHGNADITQGQAMGVATQIRRELEKRPEWKKSPSPWKGFNVTTDPTVKQTIETFWRERGLWLSR